MKIVFLAHPQFSVSLSMPRFTRMLAEGMEQRGHEVQVWSPRPVFHRCPVGPGIRKWLGYIDQFLVFPLQVRYQAAKLPADTLFVLVDHALGPWVPLVVDRPHVIHCHDFLAQRSALGTIPENPTGRSGRWYQAFIRWGFRQGRCFISVSRKTRDDLEQFLGSKPLMSEVVYNGLNPLFVAGDPITARAGISATTGLDLKEGYILHVGGNQWYKNRAGVVEIYERWRESGGRELPLLLIGPSASEALRRRCESSEFRSDIHLLSGLEDEAVRQAYAGASVFLFPSLAEGFGWPIAEAMASGCPVITTAEAPMTEVGGDAATYIARMPPDEAGRAAWTKGAVAVLEKALSLHPTERGVRIKVGIAHAVTFNADCALGYIESCYAQIIKHHV